MGLRGRRDAGDPMNLIRIMPAEGATAVLRTAVNFYP
jgi:hypothetical protein